jgi:SAM domain (Sterile alpha motif)
VRLRDYPVQIWGPAMDVGGWLRGLGLGQYEDTFRDNKIDADLLPRLTDAGLKDIGVSALGDRLRLLAWSRPRPISVRQLPTRNDVRGESAAPSDLRPSKAPEESYVQGAHNTGSQRRNFEVTCGRDCAEKKAGAIVNPAVGRPDSI